MIVPVGEDPPLNTAVSRITPPGVEADNAFVESATVAGSGGGGPGNARGVDGFPTSDVVAGGDAPVAVEGEIGGSSGGGGFDGRWRFDGRRRFDRRRRFDAEAAV